MRKSVCKGGERENERCVCERERDSVCKGKERERENERCVWQKVHDMVHLRNVNRMEEWEKIFLICPCES